MKNKKLIIIIASLIAIVVALTVTLVLVFGGSPIKKGNKMIDASANALTKVSTLTEVYDGQTAVYKYLHEVEIVDGNGQITKATSKLNPSFEFSTVSEMEVVENIDKNGLLNFNLSEETVEESKLKDGTLTLTLKADKIATFLNTNKLKTNGENGKAVFVFEKDLLISAEITFILESGKEVVMTVECKYQ